MNRRKMVNRRRAALIARVTNPPRAKSAMATAGVRIREALPQDLDSLQVLCELAGAQLEASISTALEAGHAGASLRLGQVGGLPAFFGDIQRTMADMTDEAVRDLFLRLTHLIVAEHDRSGVVGAALVFPPAGTIMNQVRMMQQVGSPAKDQMDLLTSGALGVTRIKALAVDEEFRRSGIGAGLVKAGMAPFVQLGYSMAYGIMEVRDGLKGFYRSQGFEVLPEGSPLSLRSAGIAAGVQAGAGERIFVRLLR